jgi:type VII secretion-associated serine protease mycosin
LRAITHLRRSGAVLAAITVVGAMAMLPPALAQAAPACGTAAIPAPVVSETPWPQQRFATDRLAALADGQGVLVAVIDSGVDAGHPQLAGAVAVGVDLLDTGQDGRLDCVGHGTAVASIIAARTRPGIAFRGLAPAATVLPVRVSERVEIEQGAAGRTVTASGIGTAVRLAADRGARVINLSLTTDRDDPALREAIRYALVRDVVVVAATGNRHDRGDPVPFPAAYPGVIGVGAIQPDGTRLAASQTGPYVDLVAPGANVLAAARGSGHAAYTGTSFAAPYVAATAALVRQYWPTLSAAQVGARIMATADPAPSSAGSTEYAAGVVSPYRAVTSRVDDAHVTTGPRPEHMAPPQPPHPASTQAARASGIAHLLAGVSAALATLIVFSASALRRGGRRHWRAGAVER